MKYICTFTLEDCIMRIEADDLDKLRHGFFIDNQKQLTQRRECARYWIAPAQIQSVKIE